MPIGHGCPFTIRALSAQVASNGGLNANSSVVDTLPQLGADLHALLGQAGLSGLALAPSALNPKCRSEVN